MTQRIVEMVVGRLITDEQFRSEFIRDPQRTLRDVIDRGFDLTPTEIAALVETDAAVWGRTADSIDPRVQKASLEMSRRSQDSLTQITPLEEGEGI